MGGEIHILAFDIEHEPKEISAAALNRLWDVCFDTCDTFSLPGHRTGWRVGTGAGDFYGAQIRYAALVLLLCARRKPTAR